jgi:hypothetical protein
MAELYPEPNRFDPQRWFNFKPTLCLFAIQRRAAVLRGLSLRHGGIRRAGEDHAAVFAEVVPARASTARFA